MIYDDESSKKRQKPRLVGLAAAAQCHATRRVRVAPPKPLNGLNGESFNTQAILSKPARGGLKGYCSKGDDFVAALHAVRPEKHRAGIFC